MRALIVALVVLLVLVQYRLWVGEESLAGAWRLERAMAAQAAENRELSERNRRLEAEVRDLKEGTAAAEERARRDLGLIGPDETFFQLVER